MVPNASGNLSTAFLCLTLLFDGIPLHVRRAMPKAKIMQTSLMSVQKTKSPCIPSALLRHTSDPGLIGLKLGKPQHKNSNIMKNHIKHTKKH